MTLETGVLLERASVCSKTRSGKFLSGMFQLHFFYFITNKLMSITLFCLGMLVEATLSYDDQCYNLQYSDLGIGIEGVVPPELLPSDVRAKLHARTTEKNKRAKREENKGPTIQTEEPQVHEHDFFFCCMYYIPVQPKQ